MRAFFVDIYRAASSSSFIIAFLGVTAASFFGVFESLIPVFQGAFQDGLPSGYTAMLLINSMESDIMYMILPIVAALPFTTAFIDDYKNKYIRAYLPRTNVKNYVVSKVSVTAIMGGSAIAIGILITLAVYALFLLPMEMPAEIIADENTIDISAQYLFADVISRIFLYFLSGAVWSLIGGVFASATMSKYMAYAAPFIFYFVLTILSQRYLNNIYVLSPEAWVNPSASGVEFGNVVLLVTEIVVLLSIIYGLQIKRRLKDV